MTDAMTDEFGWPNSYIIPGGGMDFSIWEYDRNLKATHKCVRELRTKIELLEAMLCEASFEVFNGPRHDWSGKTLDQWLAYLEEEVRQSEPDRWAERGTG